MATCKKCGKSFDHARSLIGHSPHCGKSPNREKLEKMWEAAKIASREGGYDCECGKSFEKKQSYSAHRSHCVGSNKSGSERGSTWVAYSYAEKFFENVFDSHKFPYEREVRIGKYRVDFLFREKKLILEVDGKQHLLPESVEYDKKRDEFLSELGWKVHRISWTNTRTEKGKEKLKIAIDEFVNLYCSVI